MPSLNNYAIVIGINDYTKLSKLNGPINDAKAFTEWLKSPSGGDLTLSNIHTIISTTSPVRPIQDDIDDKLETIYETGKSNGFNRLYFFFAGHGIGIGWNENGLCLPKWSDIFRNAALSSSEYLKTIVESGVFKEVYFFLDCCRNRKISAHPLHPQIGWPKPGVGTSNCVSFVAYAAPFDNPAFEASSWTEDEYQTQGIFTKVLLSGLTIGACKNDGTITTNSLKSFLKRNVEEMAKSLSLVQSVRFEDAFTEEGVIMKKTILTNIDAVITFSEGGNIILLGPELNEIKKGKVVANDTWSVPLTRGEHIVKNTSKGDNWNFFIDGTKNPFSYECKY